MNTSTLGGKSELKFANAAGSTQVALGLFGSQMMTALVRGVTAASIASRSCVPSRNGTRTGVAPVTIASAGKSENVGSAMTTSSPGPMNVRKNISRISLLP